MLGRPCPNRSPAKCRLGTIVVSNMPMTAAFPRELEKHFSPDLSHLIIRVDAGDLQQPLEAFLGQRGISVMRYLKFTDPQGQLWLLLSIAQPSTGPLVLELIEEGFSKSIAGIDAKSA